MPYDSTKNDLMDEDDEYNYMDEEPFGEEDEEEDDDRFCD